jgi:hypothetical protein
LQLIEFRMRKQILINYILVFQTFAAHSQFPSASSHLLDPLQRLRNYHNNTLQITINLDSLIELNYYKLIQYNQKNPGAIGYQIRIFSGSGQTAKDQAEKARSIFLSKYEGVRDTLVYDTPDYKIYVGDCRTKSEALKLLNRVKGDFPNAFIAPPRKINVSYD